MIPRSQPPLGSRPIAETVSGRNLATSSAQPAVSLLTEKNHPSGSTTTSKRGGAAAAWPLTARAQQAERMQRIGVVRIASRLGLGRRAREIEEPRDQCRTYFIIGCATVAGSIGQIAPALSACGWFRGAMDRRLAMPPNDLPERALQVASAP